MFPGARMRQRQVGGGVPTREDRLTPAILCKTPKTVYDLWVEYTAGLGGNKPACQFTAKERGKVKFKYCRRKIVWDVIHELFRILPTDRRQRTTSTERALHNSSQMFPSLR